MVLVIGEPGSGKTHLVEQVIRELGPAAGQLAARARMANGYLSNYARATVYPETKVIVPGIYDGSLFQGTDRLGRNTGPALLLLFQQLATHAKYCDYNIVAEGDRITTAKFLINLHSTTNIDVVLVNLVVPSKLCLIRRSEREAEGAEEFFANVASKTVAGKPRRADRLATGLDPKWLSGRLTKLANLRALPVHVLDMPYVSELETAHTLSKVLGLLTIKSEVPSVQP